MNNLIMLLFGFSTLIQFQLEIPEFLPAQANVICEEMNDSNFDPNCQHADYDIFRSWCLGNRCDDHAVKGYAKEVAEDGTITWYTVIKAWNLEPSEDYHLYKRYFNGCVDTDLKNMREVKNPKENRRAS